MRSASVFDREALRYDAWFDSCGVVMATTVCCAEDAGALMNEAGRVLRAGGHVLVGEIPADSAWGRSYQEKGKAGREFYRDMRLYTVSESVAAMRGAGLEPAGFSSTLVRSQCGAPLAEAPEPGAVAGTGFVCLLARKRGGSA